MFSFHSARQNDVLNVRFFSFDAIAPWYRTLEYLVFGPALQRRRLAFLPRMEAVGRAMVLGDGDGRFLEALLAHAAPRTAVDAIDLSQQMNRLAAERCRPAGGVDLRLWQADAQEFDFPSATYDLIATHFFLDCFTDQELARLVPRIAASARPGARWVVSEFTLAGGWRAKIWIALLYRCFGWATGLQVRRLPNYAAALRAAGFELEQQEFACGRLLTSQLWRRSASGQK